MIYGGAKPYECPLCKKTFIPGMTACLVAHVGEGCCHYGDTEMKPAPETPATQYGEAADSD